ncbi:unnamed protein product [Adineta ricciae]|uniref:Glycoside hydrolase family 76 protein n=2 Tax=Adineta ricciae TaxID=249248 RepID=A0A813YE07_ADIRI|nr:unnamed protein product [Adineta ricciae]
MPFSSILKQAVMVLLLHIFFIFLLCAPATGELTIGDTYSPNEALQWAEAVATRLVSCYYNASSGIWWNELAWQSGNTLESLANFLSIRNSSLKYVFNQTYTKTAWDVGGECFDDYQHWLLGWIQAYSVDPNINYLHRAADIYDIIVTRAWNATKCRGGIDWCPKNSYKNAITNELFLTSSMRLHPYATLLRKPPSYYLDWALKEWHWFEQTTMINNNYLVNDGLNDDTCLNNNQTTWTYNQGVILSGLAMLANATNNATLLTIAQNIADATIQYLTYPPNQQILREPCEPNCDNDQKLFKGIFIRHLSYLLAYVKDPLRAQKYRSFIQQNAISLWTTGRCESDGLFGLVWNATMSATTCDPSRDAATTSAALDLFVAAAGTGNGPARTAKWMLLGMGNCMDGRNESMANIYRSGVSESVCRETSESDVGAVAYDYELKCDGSRFCRIRTLSDRHATPEGWTYEDGNALTVTNTNGMALVNCYLRTD